MPFLVLLLVVAALLLVQGASASASSSSTTTTTGDNNGQKKEEEELPQCDSLPRSLASHEVLGPLFASWGFNTDTEDCGSCTKFSGACAWCPKGRLAGITVLGVNVPDIELEEFCWTGTPWELVNNTADNSDGLLTTKFSLVCDEDTYNFQCGMTGKAFVGLMGALTAAFCCCCSVACCCFCYFGFCRSRHHHHHGYQKL